MYSSAQLAVKYCKYWLTASNGKGHGVHSPFVFGFIRQVLTDKREFDSFRFIENTRQAMRQDTREINVPDFGAGSRMQLSQKRRIAAIARSSLKPKKFSQLLFRMVHWYKPATVLELGTSLGITTAYLAAANTGARVTTMEGAPEVAALARENFNRLRLTNIKLIVGNFDDTLPQFLNEQPALDFVFIDGNHRKAPTLNYFYQLLSKAGPGSVFIFDDIHWSREMEAAWHEIKQHPAVTLTIDLFFIGVVFFRTEQKTKQDFVIRY